MKHVTKKIMAMALCAIGISFVACEQENETVTPEEISTHTLAVYLSDKGLDQASSFILDDHEVALIELKTPENFTKLQNAYANAEHILYDIDRRVKFSKEVINFDQQPEILNKNFANNQVHTEASKPKVTFEWYNNGRVHSGSETMDDVKAFRLTNQGRKIKISKPKAVGCVFAIEKGTHKDRGLIGLRRGGSTGTTRETIQHDQKQRFYSILYQNKTTCNSVRW